MPHLTSRWRSPEIQAQRWYAIEGESGPLPAKNAGPSATKNVAQAAQGRCTGRRVKTNNLMNDEETMVTFTRLSDPDPIIATTLNQWANDPLLIPLIRPNRNKEEFETPVSVTTETLRKRLEHNPIYLIYTDGQLVGEMDYQIDPGHLFKRKTGTAWIGIIIGEASARGKGIGTRAMRYLEEQIRMQGLKRIELGVFEFNKKAIQLYKRLGYREIGRIDDFTYWQGRMWQDIRMEKYLK